MLCGVDMLAYEKSLWQEGHVHIAGVDEAGRGPLAGPVVACSVILTAQQMNIEGVNDSKQLRPAARLALYKELKQNPDIIWAIGIATVEEIDQLNILQATKLAMRRSVAQLSLTPSILLVDGMPLEGTRPSQGIIKGDQKSYSIAAASILAKEWRDEMMLDYDKQWPEYGFAKHKGYGTKVHMEALNKLGPCPIHRQSFAPVQRASASLQERHNHV